MWATFFVLRCFHTDIFWGTQRVFSHSRLTGQFSISFSLVIQPEEHQLVCGRDKIEIGFNVSALMDLGLDPISGHLAVVNCSRFRVQNDKIVYEVETREGVCGNILRVKICQDKVKRTFVSVFPRMSKFVLLYFRSTALTLPTQILCLSILQILHPSLPRWVFHFAVNIPWTRTPAWM